MLVKHENNIYRLPVRRIMNEEEFRKFQDCNKSCEVLIFALNGGHTVVPLDSLTFHDSADDRLHN